MKKSWWAKVLFAFLLSRIFLLIIGWFSQYWPVDPARPVMLAKGYWATPNRLLDIWFRADSGYYSSIIASGYSAHGDLHTVQSNLAFFPLYPLLLKPIAFLPIELGVFVGVLFSNLCLLGAVIVFYKLAMREFGDDGVAYRAVWFLLLFPTSFFASSFYAEALFLLLSVTGMYAVMLKKWGLAALLAGLLLVTKLIGVSFFVVMLLAYDWKQAKLKDVLLFAVAPIGLLVFLAYDYFLTGDPFAPFTAQAAWGKFLAWPWVTFFNNSFENPVYLYLERVLAIATLVLIPVMFAKLSKQLSGYGALLVAPNLFSGTLGGFGRHFGLDFPIALVLARLSTGKKISLAICILFAVAQAVLMVLWSQLYPIW